jgi:hypothetical protein
LYILIFTFIFHTYTYIHTHTHTRARAYIACVVQTLSDWQFTDWPVFHSLQWPMLSCLSLHPHRL